MQPVEEILRSGSGTLAFAQKKLRRLHQQQQRGAVFLRIQKEVCYVQRNIGEKRGWELSRKYKPEIWRT